MWRFVFVGLMVLSSTAYGQGRNFIPLRCAPEIIQEQVLREKYKEEPVAFGVVDGGTLLAELWISEENDAWTITLRTIEGTLCGVMTGKGWKEVPKKVKGIGL